MNEELQILLDLVSGEGKVTDNIIQSGNSSKVEGVGQQPTLSQGVGQQPQEVEITDDMRAKANGVVNKARRGGNGIQGVTNFLQQPAVQEALINFGQSIANSGNWTGQPNPVNQIGDFGKDMIRSTADQRALEAFERGEDPAQAAGQFANPELVTQLQQQQTQIEQFNEELEIQKQSLGVEESALAADTAYKFAQLTQNKELAKKELKLAANAQEIDQQLTQARTNYVKAQQDLVEARTEAVGEGDTQDTRQIAEAATEYLDTLQEQRRNLQDQLGVIEDIKEEAQAGFTNWNVNETWVRRQARELGISVTDDQGNLDIEDIVSNLETQQNRIQQQINMTQDQEEIIRVAQSQRLGGGQTDAGGEGEDTDEDTGTPSPRGTREAPVSVNMQELSTLPPGSYAELFGDVYLIGQDGQPRLITQDEEGNE